VSKKAISLHRKLKGKIYIESKIPQITDENLQLIYTPGVATVCKEKFVLKRQVKTWKHSED